MATYTRKKYFSQKRRWQSWLDVEAALARVLGREGIIPQWAACKIADKFDLDIPIIRSVDQIIRGIKGIDFLIP